MCHLTKLYPRFWMICHTDITTFYFNMFIFLSYFSNTCYLVSESQCKHFLNYHFIYVVWYCLTVYKMVRKLLIHWGHPHGGEETFIIKQWCGTWSFVLPRWVHISVRLAKILLSFVFFVLTISLTYKQAFYRSSTVTGLCFGIMSCQQDWGAFLYHE